MATPLDSLLVMIRSHPMFPRLLEAVPKPHIPQFKQSKAKEFEAENLKWVFQSGAMAQHETWIAFLSGRSSINNED